jgi:hypothetical protein
MFFRRVWPCLLVGAHLLGCSADSEVGLLFPSSPTIVPISATVSGGMIRVRFVLEAQGSDLKLDDRIRAGAEVVWLERLTARDATLFGLQLLGSSLSDLSLQPSSLTYRVGAAPLHLGLVVDNSAAAASADPELARITSAQSIVDYLVCRPPQACASAANDVTLIALQSGAAEVRVQASRDAAALTASLTSLAGEAGGVGPLWAGLEEALDALRPLGAPSALLLSIAHGADPAGTAAPPSLLEALRGPPTVPLYAVQHDAHIGGELRRAVEASGGALRALGGGLGLAAAFTAARSALFGAWEIEAPLANALPEEGLTLKGQLVLRLGRETRSAALDLPLLRP